MNLKKIIAVLFLGFLCTTGMNLVTAQAEEVEPVETVISNQGTSEEDSNVIADTFVEVDEETMEATEDTEKNSITTQSITKKEVKKKNYTKAELRLMSCIIYCEASGEPYAGKLAVGIVVMNRKSSKSFPNTIRGVIYQRGQFGPVRNGSLKRALREYDADRFKSDSEKASIKAAKAALNGQKTVSYRSKKYNMKSFHFFSTRVIGKRLTIKNHQFK